MASNITARKIDLLRKKLEREVNKYGIQVTIKHGVYVSDGSNGYIKSGETQDIVVNGILKRHSTSNNVPAISDGARVYSKPDTLTVVYDDSIHLAKGDRFEYDDLYYTVENISNVGEQNLYLMLVLTGEPKEVNGYGQNNSGI